jgi:hypothetical protein
MTFWTLLWSEFGIGAAGGFLSTLLAGGIDLPKREANIIHPGFIGTTFVGGAAAVISWLLYGPLASVPVGEFNSATFRPTFGAFAGAVLIGIGGSQWLKSESDKRLLRAAGVAAAEAGQNPELAKSLAKDKPTKALQAAQLALTHTKEAVAAGRPFRPEDLPPGPQL